MVEAKVLIGWWFVVLNVFSLPIDNLIGWIYDRYLRHQFEYWTHYWRCFKFLPEAIKLLHFNMVAINGWFHCMVLFESLRWKVVVISFRVVGFKNNSWKWFQISFDVPLHLENRLAKIIFRSNLKNTRSTLFDNCSESSGCSIRYI